MTDDHQNTIPSSFLALYLEPGRTQPDTPREVIARRYEPCLAQSSWPAPSLTVDGHNAIAGQLLKDERVLMAMMGMLAKQVYRAFGDWKKWCRWLGAFPWRPHGLA